jgi:hypothetical protein
MVHFSTSHTVQKVTEARCYIKGKSVLMTALMMVTVRVPNKMEPVTIGLICWFGRGT